MFFKRVVLPAPIFPITVILYVLVKLNEVLLGLIFLRDSKISLGFVYDLILYL